MAEEKEENMEEVEEKTEQIQENIAGSEIFECILDKDEKILKVFKPNKTKMFWSMLLTNSLGFWWWLLLGVYFCFGFAFGNPTGVLDSAGEEIIDVNLTAGFVALAIVLVLVVTVFVLFFLMSYKKTFYAYSNKRVIMRHGIIGVDYKSLDMDMIGAVAVDVTVLDKIVGKNTGIINFGSMASPIGGNAANLFKFVHIKDPYAVYKEIKTVIDEYKSSKK